MIVITFVPAKLGSPNPTNTKNIQMCLIFSLFLSTGPLSFSGAQVPWKGKAGSRNLAFLYKLVLFKEKKKKTFGISIVAIIYCLSCVFTTISKKCFFTYILLFFVVMSLLLIPTSKFFSNSDSFAGQLKSMK